MDFRTDFDKARSGGQSRDWQGFAAQSNGEICPEDIDNILLVQVQKQPGRPNPSGLPLYLSCTRACSHKLNMRILERIFDRFKAKICRVVYNSYVPGVLQGFLTQKMAEIRLKNACERLCEHALKVHILFTVRKPLRQLPGFQNVQLMKSPCASKIQPAPGIRGVFTAMYKVNQYNRVKFQALRQ